MWEGIWHDFLLEYIRYHQNHCLELLSIGRAVGIANGADPDVVDTQSCADAPSSLIRLIWWY